MKNIKKNKVVFFGNMINFSHIKTRSYNYIYESNLVILKQWLVISKPIVDGGSGKSIKSH